jgi:hypothetical protein
MRWTHEYAMGRTFPRFYGVSYMDWVRDEIILLPIPLNVIARWIRKTWFRLIQNDPDREWMLQKVRDRAMKDGFTAGRQSIRLQLRRHITNAVIETESDTLVGNVRERAEQFADNVIEGIFGDLLD